MPLGISFIKALRYHGIANTEFKYDSRDGKFKLLKSTQDQVWNYSATAAGVNLSWIAYQNVVLGLSEPINFLIEQYGYTILWIYQELYSPINMT